MTAQTTVNFLPSWRSATDPSDPPPFRTCDEDGTHHFSHVKYLAKSGKHYIHAVNNPIEPTRAMLIGTGVHFILLGGRPGHEVLRFDGEKRVGNAWKEMRSACPDADILTAPEWEEAEQIAAAVRAHPVARARLDGARLEVPLTWEDGGIKCSTSGVDIVSLDGDDLADLKITNTTEPEVFIRHAFRMFWPHQLVWYRRGARANGLKVSRGLYLLGAENKGPYDVVELELTEGMIDLAERTVSLWLEKLRVYRDSNQWPGYAQSSVPCDVPRWMRDDEDEVDE